MAWLAAGLGLSALACRLPEDRFTNRVARILREKAPRYGVTVKERFHLDVVDEGGTHHQMFLENLWLRCQAHPESCDADIDRNFAAILQGQTTDAAYRKPENVRPVLKDRAWLDSARKMMASPPEKAAENALVSRPFAADMFVVYAFDLPDGMRMMSHGDLAALGLDEARLHALALENLERAAPEMESEALEPGSLIRVMHFGDSYESSRVIPHARWKRVAATVSGDLVVAVPSRDYVYFTGSREDLAGLRALARRGAAEMDHGISATLLRWKPDGWEALP